MGAHEPEGTRNFLVFQLAEHRCALAAECVPEVLLMPAVVRSPGQPSILDGFLNLRGTAVPVLPLHRLFQLPAPEPELHTPVIVVRTGAGLLAFRVDSLEAVASVPSPSLQPYSGNDSFNACAKAQFTLDGREAVLLSVARLLLAKERECLAQWQAQTQQRLDALEAGPE